MQFGSWNFRPTLWPSIATLLILPLLILLGFWQLDRASQKEQLMQAFERNYYGEPLVLNAMQAKEQDQQKIQWRKVRITGQFEPGHQFLLDNQSANFNQGYYVFTPFLFEHSDTYILVNRGWVAGSPERQVLPDVNVTTEVLSIIGTAKQPPGSALVLSKDLTEHLPEGLIRLQQIKLAQIEKLTGKTFLPFIVRLDENSPAGYTRKWKLPGSGKEKHYGYAFQWFAMALALLLIYVVVNTKRSPKNHPEKLKGTT